MNLKNCDSKQFIEELRGRKVICFGAGSTLIEAEFEVLTIEALEEHIAFFIDNDVRKHGLKFKYRGREFDIEGIDVFDSIDMSKYVLLITCAFYFEIYEQIKDILSLKNVDCYMYNCVCSYPNLDIANFFEYEIFKIPFREYRKILKDLRLKNKHQGERCFIIGNGPSLKVEDLEKLKNEITFGANRIFKIFDDTEWRPTYYFCTDYLMYGLDFEEINKVEAKLRFVPRERALAAGKIYEEITYYDREVKCVSVENGEVVRIKEYEFSENVEERVFGGQSVLFDALQFAVYMGFKEIYFLGADHSYKREVLYDGTVIEHDIEKNHFNSKYDEGLDNAIAVVATLYAVDIAYQKAREICDAKGITIKNATRGGNLEIFERVDFDSIEFKEENRE